jgi:hypothetical protein
MEAAIISCRDGFQSDAPWVSENKKLCSAGIKRFRADGFTRRAQGEMPSGLRQDADATKPTSYSSKGKSYSPAALKLLSTVLVSFGATVTF